MEDQAKMASQAAEKAAQPLFVDNNSPEATPGAKGAPGALPTAPSEKGPELNKVVLFV